MPERLLDPAILASLGRLDLVARTVVEGFLIGLHRSPYHGLSQEFAEHRPYIAGDEMRRIDWRIYGRTDRLYVKEFEEETNVTLRLFFDTSGSLAFKPRNVSKLQYGRFLLAALSYLAIKQNDRVGLICFDEVVRERVDARGGRRHLHAILAALERTNASGRTAVGSVVVREASQWKSRGLVVIVSDLYDSPSEIVEAVARVRRVGHDVIVFHLMDQIEIRLDKRGLFEFHDLETSEVLIADTDRVRKQYLKMVAQQREFFQCELERTGAEYVQLDTSNPLDKALATYLRKRKQKRGNG